MTPAVNGRAIPLKWMATLRHAHQEALFQSAAKETQTSRFETVQLDCSWGDVAQVDRILPDAGVDPDAKTTALLALKQGKKKPIMALVRATILTKSSARKKIKCKSSDSCNRYSGTSGLTGL